MHRSMKMILFVVTIMILSCSGEDSRSMWEPSHVTIGVEPNDDAPVRAGEQAATNFAQHKTLMIEYGDAVSYFKFFIPGFSRVDSAVLHVQTKDSISAGPVSVAAVSETDWNETRLSWDQRPAIDPDPLLTVFFDKPNTVYELDLTDFVKPKLESGNYDIVLCFQAGEEGTRVGLASVEDYDNLKPRFMISGLTYVPPAPPSYAPATFTHPGILVTRDQIDFVRTQIQTGQLPWSEAFAAARNHEYAQPDYKASPVDTLRRTGFYSRSVSTGYQEINRDARAALINAQLWALTDSLRYVRTAMEILDAWASTNTAITGGNDKLTGATTCIQFTNAAELIKHSDAVWPQADQDRFETWLRSVYWPLLRDFIPAYNGNWDALIGQGLISMGIYLDDSFIFDHAVHYYLNGVGNGRMTYYIREDSTTQETLRDQGHEQMGIGGLAGSAETAWHQGVDLYSREDNRLLKGVEGTAKRVVDTDYRRLPIWESIYNHYHNRMCLDMPYTEAILTAPGARPEGYGSYRGFSTLFFYGVEDR
jgi:hypothetical protein